MISNLELVELFALTNCKNHQVHQVPVQSLRQN